MTQEELAEWFANNGFEVREGYAITPKGDSFYLESLHRHILGKGFIAPVSAEWIRTVRDTWVSTRSEVDWAEYLAQALNERSRAWVEENITGSSLENIMEGYMRQDEQVDWTDYLAEVLRRLLTGEGSGA